MLLERLADQLGYAGTSAVCALRMPGTPFSLVTNGERDGHKRRLVAFLNTVADENVEAHFPCHSKASDHAA